jgi:hypothetical protein
VSLSVNLPRVGFENREVGRVGRSDSSEENFLGPDLEYRGARFSLSSPENLDDDLE